MVDAVLLGSVASVIIACVVFGFLVVKIKHLMDEDSKKDK